MGHHETHIGGQDGGPYIPRPVGVGKCADVLGQSRHTKGLVKDSAVLVPVAERIPAGAPEQGEGDASLSHGCSVQMFRLASECCASQLRDFIDCSS